MIYVNEYQEVNIYIMCEWISFQAMKYSKFSSRKAY